MATKKKTKVEEVKVKKPAKKTTKKKDSITFDISETKVVKGSHLTITYNNGYPEKLEWDDEALIRDVREALLKAESTIPASTETKPKRVKKVK